MGHSALAFSVLLCTVAFVRGGAPSAGACGPTSVPNVPGCWGLDGCAYVIASDLGSGAACSYDYCNCNETPVPLLPETISGTTTIGCASWTTQPSVSNCPTAAPVIPAPGGGGAPTKTSTLASGATVVVGTIAGGATETETFEPTTYTQFASVTATITTTIVNAQSSTVTVVVGPSGVAWIPYDPPSGVPNLPPPSVLPGAPFHSQPSNVPLPPGGTVRTATIGSSTITETFVPTTVPTYSSLVSTLTTSSLNAQGSLVTFLIGPGGVQWTPFNFPSGSPGIPPPTVLSVDPNAPSKVTTRTAGTSPASYASVTGAFANTAQSQTTVVAGGITIPYAISTFPDLTSITAVTTVTTAVTETNKDGTHFTIPAAIIIVGPGGRWWNGGTGGFGINLPSCIWPFCPPGGGGDIGGAGSGESPNDPDTPGSPEKPSDPDDPNDDNDTTTTRPSSTQVSSTPSSSCVSKTIASDCSVICSTPTGLSTLTCATNCYSTVTGCSATGITTSTTESGGACALPTGWGSNLATDEDAPMYEPLGPAAPGSVNATTPASNTATVTTKTNTAPSGPTTATGTGASSPPVGGGPSKATPTCLADGAPWYSPTSWCDCGPSSTYATLSPTAGATSANCAYTSLPASTIRPVSTGTAPTNIPGQGGLPGCAAVVSVSGTSAYCNCGGTPAPTLKPTSSGLMNCDYTIQPTSSYNPAIPPSAKSSPPPSPTTNTSPAKSAPPPSPTSTTCRLHLWQGLGQEYTQPEVVIDLNITYASDTTLIGHNASSLNWGQPLTVGGSLPNVLSATPRTGVSNSRRSASRTVNKRIGVPPESRPLFENGPIDFAYGTQTWDTSAAQCTVGGWDNGDAADFFGALIFGDNFIPNRQLECTFDCPGPGKSQKREVAVPFGRSLEVEEDSRRNIFARDPSATTDDGPTAVDENLLDVRAMTDHGAAWQKYAPKGASYYAAWQAKTGPDADYQCDSNFEQQFNVAANPPTICSPVNSVQPLLSSLGIGTGKEYYYISLSGPQNAADGTQADFTNTISPAQGVFLANANDRGALPSDPNDPMYDPNFPNGRQPVPWQFSSVAWWMWVKSCLTANPSWVTNPAQADYSGIKYFFRREITNEDTQSILNECFTGQDITKTLTWTPADTDQDTNPFWALLGSPNGNGIIYFLTDNKVALKGKGIASISATTINGYYTMWATFE